jgi:putative transposase
LVNVINARSSRLLRQEIGWLRSRLPTVWTNPYFVATVGSAPGPMLNRYVDDQNSR